MPHPQTANDAPAAPGISVIVPTLNERACLAATLDAVALSASDELIVVDAGSSDATPDIARRYTSKVYQGPRGRARQMNQGARRAGGDILLFLHADTLLPPGVLDAVRRALQQPGTGGGAFRLSIAPATPALRLVRLGHQPEKPFRRPALRRPGPVRLAPGVRGAGRLRRRAIHGRHPLGAGIAPLRPPGHRAAGRRYLRAPLAARRRPRHHRPQRRAHDPVLLRRAARYAEALVPIRAKTAPRGAAAQIMYHSARSLRLLTP